MPATLTPASVADATQYKVKLKAPVARGHRKYLPRHQHVFTGAVIKEIAAQNGPEVFDDIAIAR